MLISKKWLVLNCWLCGFRLPLKKFDKTLKPILFPLGLAGSRGRARGFATLERLPWSILPTLQNTEQWNSILNLYGRLAAAYDHVYETCGFLSPMMDELIKRRSYEHSYPIGALHQYPHVYAAAPDVAQAYVDVDYSNAYTLLWKSTGVT
jgi:hypothetical protein